MIQRYLTRALDAVILMLLIAILVPSEWFKRSSKVSEPVNQVTMSQVSQPVEKVLPMTKVVTQSSVEHKKAEVSPPQSYVETLPVQPPAAAAPVVIARPVVSPKPIVKPKPILAQEAMPKQSMVTQQVTQPQKAKAIGQHYFRIGAFRQAASIDKLRHLMKQADLPIRIVQKGEITHFYVGPIQDTAMGAASDKLKSMHLPVIPTQVNT